MPNQEKSSFYTATDTIQFIPVPLKEVSLKEETLSRFDQEKNYRNVKEFLLQTRQIQEENLSKAGYLCFTEQNAIYPNAIIKAARFEGNTVTKFLDRVNFDGNLLDAVDQCLEFIKKHIVLGVVRHRSGKTEEKWDYPLDALKEAIINAIVHRDYRDTGNIQIRVFEDWMEIWSPGRLPDELEIQKVLYEDRSILRNSNMAMIFQNLGLVDNWGTGFRRMYDACLANGNPQPVFSQRAGAFVVTIHKSMITAQSEQL